MFLKLWSSPIDIINSRLRAAEEVEVRGQQSQNVISMANSRAHNWDLPEMFKLPIAYVNNKGRTCNNLAPES